MVGPIGKTLSIIAALIILGAFGAALYGLFLLGWWITGLAAGGGLVITGTILVAVAHDEKTFNADQMERARKYLAARPTAPVLTGPVLKPRPVNIFTWVVRKQDEGRFAVFPLAKNGIELREYTVASGIDPDEAWRIRNREQRAIGK
jgi:hypothetical protein